MFIKRNFDHISAGAIREKIYSGENVFSHVPSVPEKLLDFSFLDKTVLSMLAFHGGYNEHYDCDFSLYKRITQYSKKVKSIENYNLQNRTNLSYGQYVALIDGKEKKK